MSQIQIIALLTLPAFTESFNLIAPSLPVCLSFFTPMRCTHAPYQFTMMATIESSPIDIDTDDDHDNSDHESSTTNEFDIDQITSIQQLQSLLLDIKGPTLPPNLSLSEARDYVWEYVENSSPDNVDDMCLGQLSVHAKELLPLGVDLELPDVDDLDLMREFVRDLADRAEVAAQVNNEGGSCSCCGSN